MWKLFRISYILNFNTDFATNSIIIYFYQKTPKKKMRKTLYPILQISQKPKLRLSSQGKKNLQVTAMESQFLTPNNSIESVDQKDDSNPSPIKDRGAKSRRLSMFEKQNVRDSQTLVEKQKKKFAIRDRTPGNKKIEPEDKQTNTEDIKVQLQGKQGLDVAKELMRQRILTYNKSKGLYQINIFKFYQLFDRIIANLRQINQQKAKWYEEAQKYRSYFERIDFESINQNCNFFDRTLQGKLIAAEKRLKTLLYLNKKLQENRMPDIQSFHKKILAYNPSVEKQLTEALAKSNSQLKIYKKALQFFKEKFKKGEKDYYSFNMILHEFGSRQRQSSLIASLTEQKNSLIQKIIESQRALQRMNDLEMDIKNLHQQIQLIEEQITQKNIEIKRYKEQKISLNQKIQSYQQQISTLLKEREQDQYKLRLLSKLEENIKLKDQTISKSIKTINQLQTKINMLNSRIQCNTQQNCSLKLSYLGNEDPKRKNQSEGIIRTLNLLEKSLNNLQKQKQQQSTLIKHFVNNLVIGFQNVIKQYREQILFAHQQLNHLKLSFDQSTQKIKKIDELFEQLSKKMKNCQNQQAQIFQLVGRYDSQYEYEKIFSSFNKIYFFSKQKSSFLQEILVSLK